MLSIVGIFCWRKSPGIFWDMIILANSLGMCHILLVSFLFLFFLFEVMAGSEPL